MNYLNKYNLKTRKLNVYIIWCQIINWLKNNKLKNINNNKDLDIYLSMINNLNK